MATHEMEKNFINSIQSFCKFTNEVKTDLKKNIILDVDEEFYLQYLSKIDLIEKNKANFEILLKVESIVKKWIKLIEKELVRSQQLGRESETVGPLAELAYWRTILTRSSLINEFISTSIIQTHLEYLGCLKSKLYKAWKKLEDHVTAIEILAKDNIKYLYILEKFMVPLYRLEPPKISQYLPSLMFTLQMIYSFSRFFDNEEMITALFVKITNQLILSCKLYLTNNFDSLIWNTPKFKMINKLKGEVCISSYGEQLVLKADKKDSKNSKSCIHEPIFSNNFSAGTSTLKLITKLMIPITISY